MNLIKPNQALNRFKRYNFINSLNKCIIKFYIVKKKKIKMILIFFVNDFRLLVIPLAKKNFGGFAPEPPLMII